MDTAAANSFLAQVGREYPGAQHWMIAESAQNRWERARWISTGIAVAAALYDMHTTQQVLAAGGRESNFLYGSHPSTARLYGFSLGLVAGQTLAIEWLRHRHPEKARSLDRTGFFANVGSSALHIAAGVHNESVIDQQKRLAQ